MTRRFDGRVAVVCGAGSVGPGWGNGKAAAVQYARDGAAIAAIDIDLASAQATVDLIVAEGGTAVAWRCDVTQRDQVNAVMAEIVAHFGQIDVLHNNVGLPAMGTMETLSEGEWDHAMDVNLKSVFLTCQAVLPVMVRQGKGAIVNISSLAAIRYTGYPYPAYYASKAAVNHLTASMALEYARKGIRVNAISAGPMRTLAMAGISGGRTLMKTGREWSLLKEDTRMEGVAGSALYLLSPIGHSITGEVLHVDAGFHIVGVPDIEE